MPDYEREFVALSLADFKHCIVVKVIFDFQEVNS